MDAETRKYSAIFILLVLQVFACSMISGQILHLNKTFADSVQSRNWNLGKELHAILVYNGAVKSFGLTDTIIILKKNNSFEYYYNNRCITHIHPTYPYKHKLISIQFSHSDDFTFMVSTTWRSKKESFEIIILDSQEYENDLVYKLINYTNEVVNGKYIEHSKSGQLLVEGQYCQKDSTYRDRIEYFNPENYKSIIKKPLRTKFAVKTGTWKYYSIEGTPLKEEVYEPCM
jgi:hypothetical protein